MVHVVWRPLSQHTDSFGHTCWIFWRSREQGCYHRRSAIRSGTRILTDLKMTIKGSLTGVVCRDLLGYMRNTDEINR